MQIKMTEKWYLFIFWHKLEKLVDKKEQIDSSDCHPGFVGIVVIGAARQTETLRFNRIICLSQQLSFLKNIYIAIFHKLLYCKKEFEKLELQVRDEK